MIIHKRSFAISFMLVFLAAASVRPAWAQIGLGLNPARAEVEIIPGSQKTVGFRVESPTADADVRGRLILTPADWAIDEAGEVRYLDPGTTPDSASSWIVFSPSAISIAPGQSHLVRVTAEVPADAKPGVYRTAIFVQERPSAAAATPGQHLLILRFRYVFTLYVIVPPVASRGEFVDVQMVHEGDSFALVYDMKNVGSRHLRPKLSWSIRDVAAQEINAAKNQDGTVLLPFARLKDKAIVGKNFSPGRYEVSVQVDFRDGEPVQAINRIVDIAPATAAAIKQDK